MSKSKGRTGVESIPEPTEAEKEAIYEEYDEVKTTSQHGRKIHPLDASGEPVCMQEEKHNVTEWSRPKPIRSYPIGSKELCLYCVRIWRREQ